MAPNRCGTTWAAATALTIVAGALIGLAGLLGGCSAETNLWLYRQFNHPSDYDDMPLREAFDTEAEIAQLRDDRLRSLMSDWLVLRRAYLKAWRDKGDYDDLVKRVQSRRATMKAAIQHRVTQLMSADEPLTKAE